MNIPKPAQVGLALVALFVGIGLFGYLTGDAEPDAGESSASGQGGEFVDYDIIKDTKQGSLKRTVEVMLPTRMGSQQLKSLADKIHEPGFDKTFIGYNIQGESPGHYWATTHYTPDLKVNILGSTLDEHVSLDQDNVEVDGEILGKWHSNRMPEHSIVFYSQDGNLFVKRKFSDGSVLEGELTQEEQDGKTIYYDESGKQHGEYYVIASDGDLQFWSENGNYYTAPQDD
ncbi:hypothetical protein SAMN05421509_10176 [Chromohalobacter canadensis]|uniref:Uncharacterized protein n=1 Tax=Chromohalobacter canadensis TaxID=141389 RepID=A0A285VAN0_9GAMM|nr:hypothetical protein [Chromohalobacter canadensis]SOC51017.1 hypothetical protein SAMN05421509_10176 [Chromohalobacter canadensis]